MPKQGGLGDNLYVAGYDYSGDFTALGRIGGGPAPLDGVTGIDKYAQERLGGVRDGAFEATTWFNPDANMGHDRLSLLPTTDVIMTYCRGTALGNPAAAIVAKQTNYDGTRGNDGSFTFGVNAVANGYGVEWGRQLTAGKRADTEATNGTAVDFGAAGEFGLQMYVHLFAFTGTSVTIKVQESSDDDADTYEDVVGATSGALTAIGGARAQTARALAVERYLRVVTTGTFTVATFAVMVIRNGVEVNF